MNNKKVPLSFIVSRISFSWQEYLWGCDRGYIKNTDILDIAIEKLAQGAEDSEILDLAVIGNTDIYEVREIAQRLADKCVQQEESDIRRKWMYLKLAWLYENKGEVEDPLGEVEEIYSDFDYPEEMENFVRYMPASSGYDPINNNLDENYRRLFENWKQYLSSAERILTPNAKLKD